MTLLSRSLLVLFISIVLSGCAGFSRQTRLVENESEFKKTWIDRRIMLSEMPVIYLDTPCVSDQLLFFGPLFLPVIPNPLWPFDYAQYKKQNAVFFLSIKAPPKMLNWDAVAVNALLNGDSLEVDVTDDQSSVWSEQRKYRLKSRRTCGQIEDGEITLQVDGVPEAIKTRFKLRHKWQFSTE